MAPANPGGGTDQIARLMQAVITQDKLSPRPIEVVNRGGAAGAIGLAELVSRHHGDPYMIMATGSSVIGTTAVQKSPFQVSDAAALARLSIDHLVIAVPTNSRFQSIGEFIEAFRTQPDSVTWCGGSAGGVDNLLVGLIAEACDVPTARLRYIAYAGGGAASAALMGGQVTVGVTGYSEWRGLAEGGRIRILAAATPERFGDKSIATLKEGGLDLEFHNWRGVFAPPGLEAEHLAWWRSLLDRMHASQLWHTYLERSGWQDGYLVGEEFERLIRSDQQRYARILNRLGIGGSSGSSSAMGPYSMPAIIGVVGAVALGATVVEQVRHQGAAVPAGNEDDDDGGGELPIWRRFLAGAALSLGYILTMSLVGFLLATPVFILALSLLMGSKRLVRDGIAGIILTVAVWALFTKLLYVNLP